MWLVGYQEQSNSCHIRLSEKYQISEGIRLRRLIVLTLTFERIRIFSRYLFVYILFSMKKDSRGNRYFLRRDQFKLTIITASLFYVFVLSLIFMFPINPTENEKWILGFVLISIGFFINVIQKALNKILNDWELIVLSSF